MQTILNRVGLGLSTGLGVGYLPKMPGTFGTLWGVLLFFGMQGLSPIQFTALTILLILMAVWAVAGAMVFLGRGDSRQIVIDEVVGYLVTVAGIPFGWPAAGIGFVLFRFFDILKPFPIRWLDRNLKGPWGVVMDDVAAGIAANLVLRLVVHFWRVT